VIKARVTNRSGIKGFAQRQRGTESKLASVDLLDESGGEIRATMYGAAVDRFYPVMTEGRVVIVRHANLKIANKRFSSLVHDYEITLNTWSEVIPCDGAADDGKIEQQRYNFVAIADCERLDAKEHADRSFDVIGCVRQVGAPLPFIAKMSGKPMIKRIIVITDRSGRSVTHTHIIIIHHQSSVTKCRVSNATSASVCVTHLHDAFDLFFFHLNRRT
jgi:replication factor A1